MMDGTTKDVGLARVGEHPVSEEQTWVEQARAGDEEAFSRLVEAYQTPVYNLTYRLFSVSIPGWTATIQLTSSVPGCCPLPHTIASTGCASVALPGSRWTSHCRLSSPPSCPAANQARKARRSKARCILACRPCWIRCSRIIGQRWSFDTGMTCPMRKSRIQQAPQSVQSNHVCFGLGKCWQRPRKRPASAWLRLRRVVI